jgi:transposase-like protein
MPTARNPLYRRHRFPPEVISHAVWLNFRFPLSLRIVEEMLAERGICVSYEQRTRRRERIMKRFKSARQAQRFLSVPRSDREYLPRPPYPESTTAVDRRAARETAFAGWREITKTSAID